MKYHLSENGPLPCNATERACPVGGEHFTSEAEANLAYAVSNGGPLPMLKPLLLKAKVHAAAGGRYFAIQAPTAMMEDHKALFRLRVPQADAMMANKLERDRKDEYHITVITPPERKSLGKFVELPPNPFALQLGGIGRAEKEDNVAYFVVASSPEVQAWRRELGLPQHHLHITLGFAPKDVHGVDKSDTTIVFT